VLALTACLASSISRQSAGSSLGSQSELDRLLETWQNRLGLSEWTIQARLVLQNSLGSEENGYIKVADISYDHDDLTATIRVGQAPREQIEESLLHELVHLQLEAWQPPSDPVQEEQTVETIANALHRSWNLQ